MSSTPILSGMNGKEKIDWIAQRLLDRYGEIEMARSDPLEELITTILSQNTNDTNRDRAYRSLIDRFGSLAAVKEAPVELIAEAIKIGGLHNQKSIRIKNLLERIMRERGSLDISFLDDLPLDRALFWLLSFPGVGRKTAGIVMLFSFDKPYFPVDTHIKRVTGRLELIGPKDDPHQQINELLPPDPALMRRLHLHLIRLGREICHPRNPNCPVCVLSDHCAWPVKAS
ncbi:MAG: endonuclease III [Candidatus Bipolaricaulota bacterium]|nr:endonuclease III [Candidatus Bipolaricaulota bacterium]